MSAISPFEAQAAQRRPFLLARASVLPEFNSRSSPGTGPRRGIPVASAQDLQPGAERCWGSVTRPLTTTFVAIISAQARHQPCGKPPVSSCHYADNGCELGGDGRPRLRRSVGGDRHVEELVL